MHLSREEASRLHHDYIGAEHLLLGIIREGEGVAVELLKKIGICDDIKIALENASLPTRSSLTEAALANMESFLDTLGMVFPAIRVDMFLEKSRDISERTPQISATQSGIEFELNTPKHGISATASLIGGEMVVRAGSKARSKWSGTTDSKTHYFKLFDELFQAGVLALDQNKSVFTKDYAFSSPSAAASVINGRSANGRREWKHVQSGQTFGAWETQQLASEDATE